MSSSPWASRPGPKLLNIFVKDIYEVSECKFPRDSKQGTVMGLCRSYRSGLTRTWPKSCSWDRIMPHTGPGSDCLAREEPCRKGSESPAGQSWVQSSALPSRQQSALQAALAKGGQWGKQRDHSSLHSTWESIWNTSLECPRMGDVLESSVVGCQGSCRAGAQDRGWGSWFSIACRREGSDNLIASSST